MKTRLLTVAQTAELLNVRVCTVRSWLARRKLPRVSVGRCVRVPEDSVLEFIEKNTVAAREPRQ